MQPDRNFSITEACILSDLCTFYDSSLANNNTHPNFLNNCHWKGAGNILLPPPPPPLLLLLLLLIIIIIIMLQIIILNKFNVRSLTGSG
jgi:hypothetical protein